MKKLLRSLGAVAVVTVAAGIIAGFAGSAFAANPPWEPDPNSVGGLVFYNAAGQQVTGGNVTDSPIAAYIQGTATIRSGDTKATLYGYLPKSGQAPGAWSGGALTSATTFPNASAPSPLNTSPLPLLTGASAGGSVAALIAQYPNTDTSNDGYAGLYVLRLETSASGQPGNSTYDSADISVTGTGNSATWSVVYPAITLTSTTTSLVAAPTSPQVSGTSVTLTATVSPSAPGTVQFEYGTGPTLIGSPVTVSGGTASTSTTALPVGTDALSAVFTPAAFSAYSGSTGTASYVVTAPPADATNTALGVNPSTAAADTAVSLTATVTDTTNTNNALGSGSGQVEFFDNGTSTADTTTGGQLLQTVPLGTGGIATLSWNSFAQGAHNIVAEFLPTNTSALQSSLSGVVLFTATAPTYAPDPQTLSASIPSTGSLVISTPYGPTNEFQLGTAVLSPSQGYYETSAQFGGSASGTQDASGAPGNGVTITDTRSGDQGWTASAEVTNFSDGATPTPDLINGQNLAFTGLTDSYPSGNALTGGVTLTGVPSTAVTNLDPYSATATGDDGLGGAAHEFASAAAGDSVGTVYVDGTLTLIAPTSTPAGTYTATLTFTVS
jgi:hypothetical protein